MAAVEFVNNPERGVSTHSWTVQGISQLTRENKLSSLPFWVPNDAMKTHQFHLVLLKGLVPAANADDDAYGLVLEVVPPPTDPAKGEAAASAFPGCCYVTVRVVNHSEPPTRGDIVASQTALLDEANSQVGFPELLPAAAARDAAFVSGEPPAVTFVLTIHTGVNVFAQQITNSVSSLWSTLTDSVSKLVSTSVKVYHESRKEFEEAIKVPEQSPQTAAAAVAPSPAPWDVVPAKWVNRAPAWHDLVFDKAVGDDGLFLHGPERPITEDERQLLLQSGFNYRALMDLYTQFDFDRDVHEGLLASPAIRQQRYQLVPAKIKEGLFWANYFWKTACLATCESDAQVRALLTVLNAPPATVPNRPDPTVKGLSDTEVMMCATDAQEAGDLLLEYLNEENREEDIFLMETAASTCEDHVKRLELMFRRTDLTQNTLLVVGTTLRRLRERIAKYHEVLRKREAAQEAAQRPTPKAPPQESTVPTASSSAPSPVADTAAAADMKQHEAEEGSTPTKAAPSASPAATPPQASPEPSAPPTSHPEPGTVEGVATGTSAGALPERATSGSAPMVAFPKMPWEEEEDGV